jgi:hypothetical protein
MDYYKSILNFFNGTSESKPQGMEQGTVNTFNSINIPYTDYLLPSNSINRQGAPPAGTFAANSTNRMGQVVQPVSLIAQQNTQSVRSLDDYFLNNAEYPSGVPQKAVYTDNFADTTLQAARPSTNYSISQNQVYTNNSNEIVRTTGNKDIPNYYVSLASESLHLNPDPLMRVFFSDDNINHLRNQVVKKVKQITADSGVAGDKEGVTIQPPNMDDFFYYMINSFQNYIMTNGSICFVALKNPGNLKSDIAKLNTNVLQEYVSKMVSQINMYIYYYRDASQLPEQLSRPTYTAMKGSKSLEYNTGFTSGNSMGIASYNQVGNII